MVGSGAAPSPRRRTWGVPRELGVELDESELEALLGEVQGNAVPVEAVVRDVARCVAGVCWAFLFRAANNFTGARRPRSAERGPRAPSTNSSCDRVRATEHAPRDPAVSSSVVMPRGHRRAWRRRSCRAPCRPYPSVTHVPRECVAPRAESFCAGFFRLVTDTLVGIVEGRGRARQQPARLR